MTHASDDDLAYDLAAAAGRLLLEIRETSSESAALGKLGDQGSHDLLMAALREARPEDGILSEEGADDPYRLDHQRVWIVDPLDGTREYTEPPRDDWAVHVALVVDGEPRTGAVALPARHLTLGTGTPPAMQLRRDGPLRLAVSRTRPSELATVLAERLGAELVPMGSAGVKTMAVVLGEVDAYVHSGGQFEWDSAAPAAVALAAGLHASRLDGSPLRYNRPDPWMPDLVVCAPSLADRIITICQESQESTPS